nr:integrase, catalytic region, zinc finger, CCHC-type, peptidase aspartic, catalytic [Tanacetum cinerariifolium]
METVCYIDEETKNLMDINNDALYNILKKNQGDVNDTLGYKKKAIMVTSDLLALVAEKTKVSKQKEKLVVSSDSEGSGADDFSELKKITDLLAKAFNRRKFYSKPTNNNLRTSSTSQSANKKQEFVKTDDKKVKKKADEKRDMSKVKCYNYKKEGHFAKDCKKSKVKDYNYYKTKMLSAKKDSDEQVLLAKDQDWIESSSDSNQEINANMVFMAQIEKTVHMIMPSKDFLYNGKKGIGFENPRYFEKAKDLRPSLYDEKVIGLGYTLMFLIHSDEALEIEKYKRSRENKIEFAYDYGNLNASYVNEKINFEDDYFQEIINPYFKKIDSLFKQTSSLKPMCDLLDDNNFLIFDDESVKISPVSKMPFRKKPRDFMNARSKSNMAESLPRTICLWIIGLGCSKHMTGNRTLLTIFVEKFLGTVRFGNNDFVVIVGYGDVVIGSMTIKKVYYLEGLGHNLFSVGQFCDKGLEVAFRKSTCFVRNEDDVDLLTGDRSSNLYTIILNEVASNSLTCLLAKASFSQSWLWHQRLSHLNFAIINNLVKNYLVQVVVDDYSRCTWVFYLRSKDEASEVIISFIKKTQVNLQLQVQRVRTNNGMEFKNKTLAKFFDEVGITQQFSAARTPQQNGVVERRNRTFVEAARTMLTFANLPSESSSSSLNDDVQQSPEEVILPQINTQSISNNMTLNVDVASTSHNVFNERLEDAYFDATLRDADRVSAMQEELDQFARLEVL